MKLALAVVWQSIVLFVAAWCGFLAGMFVPSIRIQHVLIHTATELKTYDYNWIVALVVVYLLLLLIGMARKRFRETAIAATIALVLVAVVLALGTQIGIKDVIA
jgi:TRAP-type C4-dicarboxylate transport system permease large subunit